VGRQRRHRKRDGPWLGLKGKSLRAEKPIIRRPTRDEAVLETLKNSKKGGGGGRGGRPGNDVVKDGEMKDSQRK